MDEDLAELLKIIGFLGAIGAVVFGLSLLDISIPDLLNSLLN